MRSPQNNGYNSQESFSLKMQNCSKRHTNTTRLYHFPLCPWDFFKKENSQEHIFILALLQGLEQQPDIQERRGQRFCCPFSCGQTRKELNILKLSGKASPWHVESPGFNLQEGQKRFLPKSSCQEALTILSRNLSTFWPKGQIKYLAHC